MFCDEYERHTHSFNEVCGSFHVAVVDRSNNQTLFFCDNTGTQCFYLSNQCDQISTSFLTLIDGLKKKTPNYEAIADYFSYGCIYSKGTFLQEINRTLPCNYYLADYRGIVEIDKGLDRLDDIHGGTLKEWISCFNKSISDLKCAEIITGGVDSRMVLADVLATNGDVDMVISGDDKNIDVLIAKEIASTLGKNIDIIPGDSVSQESFYKAYRGIDGMGDCITLSRLINLRKFLNLNRYNVLWGGISGELYKNSFLNQDFPIYWGQPNCLKFYTNKIKAKATPIEVFGAEVKKEMACSQERLMHICKCRMHGKTKAQKYMNAGYWIMQRRMIAISNAFCGGVVHIAPLQERKNVAIPYHLSPWKLEMQAFARNEVSRSCLPIASIRTDRGLSCSDNAAIRLVETVNNYCYLFKIALRKRKGGLMSNKRNGSLLSTMEPSVKQCFALCQLKGIIDDNADMYHLSDSTVERILVVGMAFM